MNWQSFLFLSAIGIFVSLGIYQKYQKNKKERFIEEQERQGIYDLDEKITISKGELDESLNIALKEVLQRRGYYDPERILTMTIREYEECIAQHIEKNLKIIEDKLKEQEQSLTQQ